MIVRRLVSLGVLLVGLGAFVAPSPALAIPDTVRVSLTSSGGQLPNGSMFPSVTSDGTFVVFTTRNLPGNDYSRYQVMLRNVVTNETTMVSSVANGRPQPYADSAQGVISSDASTIAFSTDATALAVGAPAGQLYASSFQVVARDRLTGAVTPVSVSAAGDWGNGNSLIPSISSTGRYVAFASVASDLVPGDTNRSEDVFVRDTVAGTIERVSVSSAEAQANAFSSEPAISGDGRYVAFRSRASNLVSGDTNRRDDIFLRDRVAGTTIRVSVSSANRQGNGNSRYPAISENGRFVSYATSAYNLVPGDTNWFPDVMVRDLVGRTTTRVSVSTNERQGNGTAWWSSVSGDGRYVAFQTAASNLTPVDSNASTPDILIRDRRAGTTWRANVSAAGQQANGNCSEPALSANGRCLTFMSEATNLVSGDTNQVTDVFWRASLVRPAQLSMRASSTSIAKGTTLTLSGRLFGLAAGLSGQRVTLQSLAPGSSWRTIKATTSASNGAVTFRFRPSATGWYRIAFAGGNGYGPGLSWAIFVRVR